ncbi:MAG TPA: sigma-70 family RNA polymerase sigma factor [Thermoanaerobaculia bacterium]|jgi:RNA polymerase sigma-70 factor (ECF subfamily)|nr:sigma-70 family RNA polymerase sigma factor [Thermoanaerobaculia bacterium]
MIPRETPIEIDEARLIREILAGQTELFEHFVRRYQRKITRVAYRFLRDAGEADCAAQESFLRAYQSLDAFREGSTFETWLTRICINWCKDRLKRRRLVVFFHQAPAREDEEGTGPEDLASSDDPSPERRAAGREIRERLGTAMESLSPRQRAIFTMKHFEEMSIPDIAELTGLDSGTIKSHLFRAAQKIRERLADFQA